jgi:transcriptional regulator with XRE-family HTH domain
MFIIVQIRFNMTLGDRIQDLRKKNDLTQAELAKEINVSHTQMARYEIKGVQPPADVLKSLADFFSTSIDYIVNGTGSDKIQQTMDDAELISQFQKIETLPVTEKKAIVKVIGAYIRDFTARQTFGNA